MRDIRDLLAGTGMATEAYSVIEQGKVDVLLQASPRDRRLIFEEAAGISRFKAKKIEAQRRLERVEQNLLRLVRHCRGSRQPAAKTVRTQATKARRYKEYADRLQELRTQVGLADWRKLSGTLQALESELTQMRDQAGAAAAQTERLEAQVLGLELEIIGTDEAIRSNDARVGQNRERIAGYEAIDRPRAPPERRSGAGSRPLSPPTDGHELAGRQPRRSIARDVEALSTAAERASRAGPADGRPRTDAFRSGTHELDELQTGNEQDRAEHLQQLRAGSVLGNQISALDRGWWPPRRFAIAATPAGPN